MLQNEKYIDFAEDNTVEILALGSIQDGIDKKDKRADLYDAKDEAGNPVKYMKEFAGCSVEQLNALNGSPGGQYNKTGKIPYVGIVDPFTLQEIRSQPGGFAAGGLMDAVLEAKKKLNAEHGPSIKRTVLRKLETGVKGVEASLTKNGAAKAFADFAKLEGSVAKEPDSLKAKLEPVKAKLVEAATADLDKADAFIGAGDVKAATQILNPLKGALKGTELDARVKELLEKLKTAAPTDAK